MTGTLNPYGDLFAELNRLQDNFEQAFWPGSAGRIRALPGQTFPVINVGSTQDAIEVLALAPGVEPSALQITIDKGLLVIAGERNHDGPAGGKNTAALCPGTVQGQLSPSHFVARRCRCQPDPCGLP